MKHGIIIAGDGQTLEDVQERKFSSQAIHLPVDFDANPKHYDVKTMSGGTNFVSSGMGGTQQETLLTIPHDYGYTPFVFAYFHALSYDGNPAAVQAGKYGDNFLSMSGSSGTVQDFLTFRVDNKKMEIVHYLADFGYGSAYTSDAAKYQIRIKYYIAPIDTKVAAYSGERDRIIV